MLGMKILFKLTSRTWAQPMLVVLLLEEVITLGPASCSFFLIWIRGSLMLSKGAVLPLTYFLGLKAFSPQILPRANSLIPVLILAPPS